MKADIKFIYQTISEWLKFAEAKHAGLLFLNSGIMFGILTFLNYSGNNFLKFIIYLSFFCLGLSILFSIISLLPVTSNSMKHKKKFENANLYFTGNLSELDVPEFKSELSLIYADYVFDKFDVDLLNQIIVNSTFTTRKYKIFKLSVFYFIRNWNTFDRSEIEIDV